MAGLVFHEHPRQGGQCLAGAFAQYVQRIPAGPYADLDQTWAAVRARPFEPDHGSRVSSCANAHKLGGDSDVACDTRCRPAQRSRIWPASMNCWEATAHFVAAALRELGADVTIHVWDRDLPSGARHVWPSLVTPNGEHLLVDLQTLPSREYSARGYTGAALPSRPANGDEWYNQALGGLHVAGTTVLKGYGLGGVGKVLEGVEGDALPDWARIDGTPPSTAKAKTKTPAPTRRRHIFLMGRGTPDDPIKVPSVPGGSY